MTSSPSSQEPTRCNCGNLPELPSSLCLECQELARTRVFAIGQKVRITRRETWQGDICTITRRNKQNPTLYWLKEHGWRRSDEIEAVPEMSWEEALALLEVHHYGFVESPVGYLVTHPTTSKERFFTENEQDKVIDYVIGQGLTWPTAEEEDVQAQRETLAYLMASREERETLAFLKIALDEDRLSDRPLFPEGYDDEGKKEGIPS